MLDISLQLVTCKVLSVSETKGKIKKRQTFHLVHFTEHLVKGDYDPSEHR